MTIHNPHTPRTLRDVACELGIEDVADLIALPVIDEGGYHILSFSGGATPSPVMRWHCPAFRAQRATLSVRVENAPRVPLSQIATYAPAKFCNVCYDVSPLRWFGFAHSGVSHDQLRGAQAIEIARCEIERRGVLRKDGKPSKSARVIQRQRDLLEEVLAALANLPGHATVRPVGALRDAITEVEDRTRADLKTLRGLQQGENLTAALHKQIRSAAGLQPDWVVDETPTLVGFAPYRGSNRLVRAVVESAKLSESRQCVVVRVPAWIAHFLLHADRSQRVQAVAAPDAALAATAAVLWDPTQDGPLGSLAAALEVAGELDQ